MLKYRAQEGCHNCKFCKCDTDVDGKSDYYCDVSDSIPQYSSLRNTLNDREDGKGFYGGKFNDTILKILCDRMQVEWSGVEMERRA